MQSQTTFTLSFWVNATRVKNNLVSVFARVTVNGKRANISLKRKVVLSEWDSKKGKARGNKQESRLLNRYLDLVKNRIYEAHDELVKEKTFICAQSIKARFLGEDSEEYSLLTLVDYHNTQMSESLTYGTLKNYFTTQKYIKLFLTKKKAQDIYLSQLTFRFLVDFEKFLRSYVPEDHQKKMENNTVMKHIQRLRKMVTLAYKMEWIDKDPFIKFKPTYIKNEREFLREDELQSIIEKEFEIDRLTLVKDLFVFSCYTGLSYIDVMSLNEDNITFGIDGGRWIITNRQKTNNKVKIPILPIAEELIEKYKGHIKTKKTKTLFPNISNQKLNSYLKEIADLCGIKKNLTFHIARHTFATTITLSNGVPIETVSKLLGHTKIVTTQIYARVIERKVSDDMKALKMQLSNGKEDLTKSHVI
ncbi:site-specific integrase [Ichthyenterobacterium magnum]|uniref:Site-specific recombinase XerD n=1 Tax=Ichthyenterobacterium magnum TaxID=1230530 RepID=A0A420DGS9_9FLAO|nr:site-specific integrase [Ichthyenterobacterium magnum]RKE92287.1 site-specific recombinase XerD [Ichthyenterobacterium magnum]